MNILTRLKDWLTRYQQGRKLASLIVGHEKELKEMVARTLEMGHSHNCATGTLRGCTCDYSAAHLIYCVLNPKKIDELECVADKNSTSLTS